MANDSLNQFFLQQEKRALVMARIALNNDDAALDIVQIAMLKHYTYYAKHPEQEWAKLFQRILQNCINDHFRKHALKQRFFKFFRNNTEQERLIESNDNNETLQPFDELTTTELSEQLEQALRLLTDRQRQAFLLRAWEGYSNKECAALMGCSSGSVKSHYFRAQSKLQKSMENIHRKEEAS